MLKIFAFLAASLLALASTADAKTCYDKKTLYFPSPSSEHYYKVGAYQLYEGDWWKEVFHYGGDLTEAWVHFCLVSNDLVDTSSYYEFEFEINGKRVGRYKIYGKSYYGSGYQICPSFHFNDLNIWGEYFELKFHIVSYYGSGYIGIDPGDAAHPPYTVLHLDECAVNPCEKELHLEFPSKESQVTDTIDWGHLVVGDWFTQTFKYSGDIHEAWIYFCVYGNYLSKGAYYKFKLSINDVYFGDLIYRYGYDACYNFHYPGLNIWGDEFVLKFHIVEIYGDGYLAFYPGFEVYAGYTLLHVGCGKGAGVYDDPHFKTFSGQWYDFMGACDLHLMHAPDFAEDNMLDVDIRTKIRYDYSYIESAVVKIGDEQLEVDSWGQYYLNGVLDAKMPTTISGYPVNRTVVNDKESLFQIKITEEEDIAIKTFKDMVSVKFDNADPSRFRASLGMMGEFETGKMVARDGVTVIEDPVAFAAEYQVHENESSLFQAVSGPQAPEPCQMPDPAASKKRRLGEASVALEDAKTACAGWDKEIIDNCIHDVMSTGDLEVAAAGAF